MKISRRRFIEGAALCATGGAAAVSQTTPTAGYICPPCGCSMDEEVLSDPGKCSDCGMILKPVVEHQLGSSPSKLRRGAGTFTFPAVHKNKTIQVNYYYPSVADENSPILLVIPGSGRNSDRYRDFWMACAQEKRLIIVALGYSEEDYEFAGYQMAGLIDDLSIGKPNYQKRGDSTVVTVNEDEIKLTVNQDTKSWIFNDFDRVFQHVVGATGSKRDSYDIFGHSAGGQILHRFALFQDSSAADRIVAANAGFYTMPDRLQPAPFGLKGFEISDKQLKRAFEKKLILLLGEKDDSDRSGGTFLISRSALRQGEGRLQRGEFFYDQARSVALAMGFDFNWHVHTVPGVGHQGSLMTNAAARLLYGSNHSASDWK